MCCMYQYTANRNVLRCEQKVSLPTAGQSPAGGSEFHTTGMCLGAITVELNNQPLTLTFGMVVERDPVWVKFKGQSLR